MGHSSLNWMLKDKEASFVQYALLCPFEPRSARSQDVFNLKLSCNSQWSPALENLSLPHNIRVSDILHFFSSFTVQICSTIKAYWIVSTQLHLPRLLPPLAGNLCCPPRVFRPAFPLQVRLQTISLQLVTIGDLKAFSSVRLSTLLQDQ